MDAKEAREIVLIVMRKVERRARSVGRLEENEQICYECGAVVEGEDVGDPCDCYYCHDCENSWIDMEGWADRQSFHADALRKQAKEEGCDG